MKTKIPHAPWVNLLEPGWQAWREWQYIKGNNPDPGLLIRLRQMGIWPLELQGGAHPRNVQ